MAQESAGGSGGASPGPVKGRWGGRRAGAGRKPGDKALQALLEPKRLPSRAEAQDKKAAGARRQPRQEKAPARDYAAMALGYATAVVDGRTPACKWVKLACARHLNDLQRAAAEPAYPYRFDAKVANRWCAQIERYPHIKGRWAAKRENIVLQPWQAFCNAVPFGWLRKDTGKRRFKKIFMLVPRKNAKSTLAAAIGLNMLTIDGEHGAEVYAGATSEKQAWEVFGPARLMLQGTPALRKKHGVEVFARSIIRPKDASRFWPIIGKPGDGASPSCSIHDEYHEQDTPDQVDTMETGMGSREQPMLVIISTAGVNLGSPCYDEQKGAEKVLEGVVENDELFAVIYTIDMPVGKVGDPDYQAGDDWASPAALEKANPNMGVSVDREFLLAQQRNAVLNAAYQNRFKTKHLDVWCSASVAGINMHTWKLCADVGLTLEDFLGMQAHFALDLASKIDICDFVQLFTKMVKGQRHYYAFARHYLPEQTVEERGPNQKLYERWVNGSRLIATPGAEIDFDIVRDDVVAYGKKFQCIEVVYDPWRATQLAHQLAKEGATVVEMQQSVRNMGAAFDEFLAAIKGGRFHHDGDPVLEWMASNVMAKEVAKGLCIPSKQKKEAKIDGIVAIVMAIARAMVSDPGGGMAGWLADPVLVVA